MNTQAATPQMTPATAIPLSRRFYWSIQREFWENRVLYFVPVAVAALFLFGFVLSLMHPGVHMHASVNSEEIEPQPHTIVAMSIMAATLLVAMYYCLDALYSERRDRSILFWKSLPVSDVTTVLSKATIPLLIMPLLMFVVIAVTQAIMLLLGSAVSIARGQSVAALWHQLHFLQTSAVLFFHLVAIHGLWYAPIYCWLLMVSAFARRAPFLWAVLPPLAIGVMEKILFHTNYFGNLVAHRFFGAPPRSAPFIGHPMDMDSLTLANVGYFFLDPGLWLGLVVAAAFLAAAVWLRRSREPM
jgi:ABC-2 type transport system permease protein